MFIYIGRSAHLYDVDNPDWVPNRNMGYKQQMNPQVSRLEEDISSQIQAETNSEVVLGYP